MTDAATPIEVDNLTCKYGSVTALENASFSVPASGVTAVLGPNGAGKSTLINCLLGLVRAKSGTARIFGHKPGSMAARKIIGAMLQETELPELLTVSENIALFASYFDTPLPVDEVLELTQLSNIASKHYKNLSGGQKRRVQFACAIIGQPKLLFLDEPTTGLDISARQSMWRIIQHLAENGTSIILTTHYLEEADNLAERIIVINQGQIIADAPTDEIRSATSGKKIKCVTSLQLTDVHTLPSVRSVSSAGRFVEIISANEVETVKALLAADPHITDLTISGTSLEEAFSTLTQQRMMKEQAA